MPAHSRHLVVLLALLFVPSPLWADDATKRLEGLDATINGLLKETQIPGLALAVVEDGKVVLLRGYGLRDLEKKLPVTPKTLFAIGSISKSFTVTGLCLLADQKKLDCDRLAPDYLPDFRLH